MLPGAGLMQGKRGVVLGNANKRSIAWGIAEACHDAGGIAFMSRRATGEVHQVDSGHNIIGMKHPDAPDIAMTE